MVVVKNSILRKNVYVKKNDFRELLNTFINQFDNALFTVNTWTLFKTDFFLFAHLWKFWNNQFSWLNITKICYFLKIGMNHFFKVLGLNNISAKNGLSILNHFCTESCKKKLLNFQFPPANFARIHENMLVLVHLDINELA